MHRPPKRALGVSEHPLHCLQAGLEGHGRGARSDAPEQHEPGAAEHTYHYWEYQPADHAVLSVVDGRERIPGVDVVPDEALGPAVVQGVDCCLQAPAQSALPLPWRKGYVVLVVSWERQGHPHRVRQVSFLEVFAFLETGLGHFPQLLHGHVLDVMSVPFETTRDFLLVRRGSDYHPRDCGLFALGCFTLGCFTFVLFAVAGFHAIPFATGIPGSARFNERIILTFGCCPAVASLAIGGFRAAVVIGGVGVIIHVVAGRNLRRDCSIATFDCAAVG
ncbi:uncharacterized protein PG986_006262 [Apiospora aurea]|uniref:Uncharacterized protein n=1 Tax=Apiospora aurea TaxID=335848 RepID=A0ABR1QK28_9PEZI